MKVNKLHEQAYREALAKKNEEVGSMSVFDYKGKTMILQKISETEFELYLNDDFIPIETITI